MAQIRLSLSGRVTTNQGVVIPSGVTVTLETDEGTPVAQQSADSSGQFSFEGLRVRNYTLTVTCKGFEPYTKDIQLGFGANLSNVNVYLNPLNPIKASKPAPLLSDLSASKKSVNSFEKGERALQRKRLGNARKFFEEAVTDSPCYARAWGEMALVDVEQKQFKDAERNFHKSIECDGQYLDAYSGLAELYKDEGRVPDAEAVLRLGIQRSPATWQFYDRLGLLHYSMKEFSKSEDDFQHALVINPGAPPDVHAHLANAYLKEEKFDKAYRQMMEYTELDPNGRFAPSIKRVAKVLEDHKLVSPATIQVENRTDRSNRLK
ncbi:MAG TPA: tetratricopeptide repeat protein [Terriglobales bacterium]|nr:tetratricopeptide repeat protein [Terriglobales bacterium]